MEVEAVYENRALKLPHELPLPQGQKVAVTIQLSTTAGQRLRGLIQWKGSQEDLDDLLGPVNTPRAGKDELTRTSPA